MVNSTRCYGDKKDLLFGVLESARHILAHVWLCFCLAQKKPRWRQISPVGGTLFSDPTFAHQIVIANIQKGPCFTEW
jgi:hypothetical protein